MEGTFGPGTSPVAFPPGPLMPVPGDDERDGSLRDVVAEGGHHEDRHDDVPDEPTRAADVVDASRIGTGEDAEEALARLRPDH